MFCPKCGSENQKINSYCRNCGFYLPDFEKAVKKVISPEHHLKINSTLTFLSGLLSLILAVLLHILFTGKDSTPIIIYLVIGFLTANFFWQAQTFWRNILLKKHLQGQRNRAGNMQNKVESLDDNIYSTDKLLNEADFTDFISTSVVEETTEKLKYKIR